MRKRSLKIPSSMTVFPRPKAPSMAQSHQELRGKGHQEHIEVGGGGGGRQISNQRGGVG